MINGTVIEKFVCNFRSNVKILDYCMLRYTYSRKPVFFTTWIYVIIDNKLILPVTVHITRIFRKTDLWICFLWNKTTWKGRHHPNDWISNFFNLSTKYVVLYLRAFDLSTPKMRSVKFWLIKPFVAPINLPGGAWSWGEGWSAMVRSLKAIK